MNPCTTTHCDHEGVCNVNSGVVVCDCGSTGYSGALCSVDMDECTDLTHECQNGGVCQNTIGNYTCSCGDGYLGEHCETGLMCVFNLRVLCMNFTLTECVL